MENIIYILESLDLVILDGDVKEDVNVRICVSINQFIDIKMRIQSESDKSMTKDYNEEWKEWERTSLHRFHNNHVTFEEG